MPEHTIPESLIEQIRTGKAALVVGAGIGVPSWKQLLERMTKALETRGRDGDDAATKDLEKLLHKGSLVRAVGFLARALGEETCDRIVEEMWAAPAEIAGAAEGARAAAVPPRLDHVPRRHPRARVRDAARRRSGRRRASSRYQELGELSPRRRTLVKMLGNFDTYVVTPQLGAPRAVARRRSARVRARAVRRGLARVRRVPLRRSRSVRAARSRVRHVRAAARHALLPRRRRRSGDGRRADGRSPHRGGQPRRAAAATRSPSAAVLEWLEALRERCTTAGVTLSQTRPDADDVDGWVALLGEGGEEARRGARRARR